MSQPYLTSYSPAIPVIDVILRLPEGRGLEPVKALIDTGADATIVPLSFIQQLGLKPVDIGFLRGPWGERRPIRLYVLDIQIEGSTLPGIEVAGDDSSRAMILGRSVLNKLILLLDGASQTTDVLTRRPRDLR